MDFRKLIKENIETPGLFVFLELYCKFLIALPNIHWLMY